MGKITNGWMNEWMGKKPMNEWMNGKNNKWMNELMKKIMNEWKNN